MNILQTERVLVRAVQPEDFLHLREMDLDVQGLKFLNGGRAKTEEESAKLFQAMTSLYRSKGLGFYTWELRSTGDFIGWGGFKPIEDFDRIELGYRLRSQYWRQGYASEVTRALILYGQNTLQLKKIYGRVHPDNTASVRILEKLGMQYVEMGRFRGFKVILYAL